MLASFGGMERLRAAEKSAKEKRIGLYANAPISATNGKASGAGGAAGSGGAANGVGRSFEATVVRVWSGDQVSLVEREKAGAKEKRVQLSSVRGPK